jgi:carboxypeptidase C (cathepsin A)
MKYLLLTVSLILTLNFILSAPEQDVVQNLFGDLYKGKIYSGYLNTTDTKKKLHYVFLPSQNNPGEDPVVLWLNGGPGCSSLLGFIQEHGPVIIPDYTATFKTNEFSWNKNANMLYLESPAGVGFSYNDNTEKLDWNDEKSGQDNRVAILEFFQKFSEYKKNDFYISGESYAGIYVPYLAKLLITKKDKINLKGILVGNGLTDLNLDVERALVDFAYQHALYSYETHQKFEKNCKPSPISLITNKVTKECNEARLEIRNSLQGINIYDIYRPCPLSKEDDINDKNYNSIKSTLKTLDKIKKQNREKKLLSTFFELSFLDQSLHENLEEEENIWPDSCAEDKFPTTFFNLAQTKEALHVRTSIQFRECNDEINEHYTMGESYSIYKDILIPSGIKVWFYSGDTDGAVPFNGSIQWIYNLGLKITEEYRGWRVNGQNAGFVQSYGNFKFITVKGTGHMVPQWKREEAYVMFNSFLKDEALPE